MSRTKKNTQTAKNILLIANAHLDPVWQWEWTDGAGEAISTFRIAAELCEKYPSFIFNHNESILYEWIREYEPSLFARIRKLAAAGRWNIMGGWFLQPDCNMPRGESIVRQILLGKSFFRKEFGQDIKTAINFDSFGHSRGMVQILAKSGFDSYVFGRPMPNVMNLANETFHWCGFDDTSVIAHRFPFWYNALRGQAANIIRERIEQVLPGATSIVLWGMGNHGGGPTKKDLREIEQLIKSSPDNIAHSTPQEYFRLARKSSKALPKVENSLNAWAIGCYTSQIRVKQMHRRLENELYRAEKMASDAWINQGLDYPEEEFVRIMKDLAETQFHDALPGSGIQAVEQATLNKLGHGIEIAEKIRARSFFALAQSQKPAKEGTLPILIYNPHPFPVVQTMDCSFMLGDYSFESYRDIEMRQNGKRIPSQVEQEDSHLSVDWSKKVSFHTRLESGMNRLDCTPIEAKKPVIRNNPKAKSINFKSSTMQVRINKRTGLIDFWKVRGKSYLGPRAVQPVVVEDTADSWQGNKTAFGKEKYRFTLLSRAQAAKAAGVKKPIDPVRIIEDGQVRTVVEAILGWDDSVVVLQYFLHKLSDDIRIHCQVQWNQKSQMLKLRIPVDMPYEDTKYIGQIMYGAEELPRDGHEAVAQQWTGAVCRKQNKAVTIINDGIYASDFDKNGIRLTLLRSPAYTCGDFEDVHEGLPKDRYSPRIDQGYRSYNFYLSAGSVTSQLHTADRRALGRNESPYALCYFPPGTAKKSRPLVITDNPDILISAVKKAHASNHLIVRIFESTGKARSGKLKFSFRRNPVSVTLNPFEIKTLKIHPKSGKYSFTDLMEK